MQDIEWIEQIELYLALADTDEKFENVLRKALVPLLTKLPTQQMAVLGVLKHINKRLISQNIHLPVKDVSLLFSESQGIISNFALIYLEMGISRCSVLEAFPLLNALLLNWHERSISQKQKLFHLTLPLICEFKKIPMDQISQMPLFSNDKDWELFLDYLLNVMMYTVSPLKKNSNANANANEAQQSQSYNRPFGRKKISFITNDDKVSWSNNSHELQQVKLKIIHFVSSDFLSHDQFLLKRFVFFLWASCDSYYELSFVGETELKKFIKPDFENSHTIQVLYDLYQGNTNVDFDSELYRAPAPLQVKLSILNHFLCKSAACTNLYPNFLQVSFDALFGIEDSLKLKMAGISFVLWILRMCKQEILQPVASVFLSGLCKLIESSQTPDSLKGSSYEALTCLCQRIPILFNQDLNFIKSLFESLENEHSSIKYAVQGTILSVAQAFKSKEVLQDSFQVELTAFLTGNITKVGFFMNF